MASPSSHRGRIACQQFTISSVIDAPIEKVWARIRDFNGLPGWHPRMVESDIEDGKNGDRHRLRAQVQGRIRRDHPRKAARLLRRRITSISYSIIETSAADLQPHGDAQAERVTDGDRTYAVWTADFDAPADKADEIAKGMGENVFQGGFNALKSHFSGQS